jgi:serine/threonine protein kinase
VKNLSDKKYYSLKIMKKARIVKLQQLAHVQNEVTVLSRTRCPFIIEMIALFQDENSVYTLLEYIPGGELYSHLRRSKCFELSVYQFYTVELACALYHLHKLKIVYRDLKPENILLTREGHVRLTEFCLAKKIDIAQGQTYTLCGTPEYLAPEIILGHGYATSVDWWSLGILLYEMVMGFPPFFGKNPFTVYQKILDGKIKFGSAVPNNTKGAISALLRSDRKSRLGCGSFDSLMNHAFFKGIDWKSGVQQLIVPPFAPTVASDGDSSNFDYYPEETIEEASNLTQEERLMFQALDEILDRPKQA